MGAGISEIVLDTAILEGADMEAQLMKNSESSADLQRWQAGQISDLNQERSFRVEQINSKYEDDLVDTENLDDEAKAERQEKLYEKTQEIQEVNNDISLRTQEVQAQASAKAAIIDSEKTGIEARLEESRAQRETWGDLVEKRIEDSVPFKDS